MNTLASESPIRIEQMCDAEDIRAIAALYPDKSPEEQAEMVRRSLIPEWHAHQDGTRDILVARRGPNVVGTVQVVWDDPDDSLSRMIDGSAMIHHLRSHPDFQNQGIGKLLMDTAETRAVIREYRLVTLGVESENTHARRLYEKWGYQVFDSYRGTQGELILAMRKDLVSR